MESTITPTQDGSKQLPNELRKDLVRAFQLCSELPLPVHLPTHSNHNLNDRGNQMEPILSQLDKVNNPSKSSLPMTKRLGQSSQSRSRQKGREDGLINRKGNQTTILTGNDHVVPPSQPSRGSNRSKRLPLVKGGCQLPLWRPSQYHLIPPHPTGNLISLAAFQTYSQVKEPELSKLQSTLEMILLERKRKRRGTGKLSGIPPKKRSHHHSPEYPPSPPPLPPLPIKRSHQPTKDHSTPLSPQTTPRLVTSPGISAPQHHSPLPSNQIQLTPTPTPSSPPLNPSLPTVSSPPITITTPPHLPTTPPVTTPFHFPLTTTTPFHFPLTTTTPPPSTDSHPIQKDLITDPTHLPSSSSSPDGSQKDISHSPSLSHETESTTGPSLPHETESITGPSLPHETESITGPSLPHETESTTGPFYAAPSLPHETVPDTTPSYNTKTEYTTSSSYASPSLPHVIMPDTTPSYNTKTDYTTGPSYATPSLPLEPESATGPSYSTTRSQSSGFHQDFVFAYKSPFELKTSQTTTPSAHCNPSQPPTAMVLTTNATKTAPTPISNVATLDSNRDQPNRHFPSHPPSRQVGFPLESVPGEVANLDDLHTVYQAAQRTSVRPTDPNLLEPAPYSTLFANVPRKYFTIKGKDPSEWDSVEENWMTNIERRIKTETHKMKKWLKIRLLARMQYVSDVVYDTIQSEVTSATQRAILTYPQNYTFKRSFDAVKGSKKYDMIYETNVADFGSLLEFQLPTSSEEGVALPVLGEAPPSLTHTFPVSWRHTPIPPIREDPIVHQIIHSHEVDVVVTSGSLADLVSYQLKSEQPFSLPLSFVNVATRDPYDDTVLSERQTLIIDKALPTPTLTPKKMNQKYFQSTLKRSFLRATPNLKVNGLATQAPSTTPHDPEKKGLQPIPERFFATNGLSYAIWKFGELNVLIRLKLHGCIQDPDTSEVIPVSLKVKLEYLPEYGTYDYTPEEMARWWVHATVRRAKLLIAHIDPLSHSLLHLTHRHPEEIYSSSNHPQKHARLFTFLFRELLKLPPHDYLLHHLPNAHLLHLYKATRPATPTSPPSSPSLTPRTRSRRPTPTFPRHLDLPSLLITTPFTLLPHPPISDSNPPPLRWGSTLPTARSASERIPFTFVPNPHPPHQVERSHQPHP